RLQGDWSSDVCSSDLRTNPTANRGPMPIAQISDRHPEVPAEGGPRRMNGHRSQACADCVNLSAPRAVTLRGSLRSHLRMTEKGRSEERRVGKECRAGT